MEDANIKPLQGLRKIVDIDDTPLGVGKNEHWSLEDHVVNYMSRSRRLIRAIEKDFPTFFIEKEIELCEERLSELKQIMKSKDND